MIFRAATARRSTQFRAFRIDVRNNVDTQAFYRYIHHLLEHTFMIREKYYSCNLGFICIYIYIYSWKHSRRVIASYFSKLFLLIHSSERYRWMYRTAEWCVSIFYDNVCHNTYDKIVYSIRHLIKCARGSTQKNRIHKTINLDYAFDCANKTGYAI